MNPARVSLDVTVAGLLAAVLLVVYWADQKGLSSRKSGVAPAVAEWGVVKSTKETSLSARLAVTPKGFDDMGKLLSTFGEGYRFEVVDEAALLDPTTCARFDAIFLTCAEPKLVGQTDVSTRLASSLRDFVKNGGTLYGSTLSPRRFPTWWIAMRSPRACSRT